MLPFMMQALCHVAHSHVCRPNWSLVGWTALPPLQWVCALVLVLCHAGILSTNAFRFLKVPMCSAVGVRFLARSLPERADRLLSHFQGWRLIPKENILPALS